MKRFVAGVLCGAALMAATGVYASEMLQTYLFPAKYVFNGKAKELSGDYVTLNYNGHAYVPIRFVAESMGDLVKFNEKTTTITVQDTNLSRKLQLDEGFLPAAAKGMIQGIPFGIGASREDVIREWGEPQRTGNWQTVYDAWFDYYYFFGNEDRSVSAIMIGGETARYSIDDVKKAIGLPLYEGVDSVLESGWSLYYEVGEYQLFFKATGKGGSIESVMFKKK
jgi:hypothetical protein